MSQILTNHTVLELFVGDSSNANKPRTKLRNDNSKMSVLLDTTLGEIVVDLYVEDCPLACKNFLKLCKTKYYNNVLFFNVQENFMAQTGDPTGTGKGGVSIYGQLYGEQAKFFEDEIKPHLKHNRKGLLALANQGAPHTNGSQFYFTTRGDDLEYLDGKHTIFGEIAEGMDVLDKINGLYVDKDSRPYQDVRIKHTYVLDDPFPDPELLQIPPKSPERERPEEETVDVRLAADEKLDDADGRTEEEIEQSLREKEAKSRAVVLEMIGDLPDADVKPPDEVLFVCKLNPVTESSDLDMAFCRFGPCKAEVIRDSKTGDSLCYAFVEFQDKRHCEEAYFKMNNVLLDDRRLKVDFSQSVSKLWNKFKRRPWEQHSKADGDPYSSEKNGNRGRRDVNVGKNLRLKHQPVRRGGDFELVGSDDEQPQRARADRHNSGDRGHRDSRPRDKDRGRDRDRDRERASRRSRSRETSPTAHKKRDKDRSRSRGRDRDDRKSTKDSGRDRSRDRDRGKDRERDSGRGRDHVRRSRDRNDGRKKSRRSRSRSRSNSYDRGSSKRR